MNFNICPIAYVSNNRHYVEDDFWGDELAKITLIEDIPSTSLDGLIDFSHVEVLFFFHQVEEDKIVAGNRHPRNNNNWPSVGIFSQRGKNRPNRIGSTICKVLALEGRSLVVMELDAIDGTPVLDIKPIMQEFLPREPVIQPAWSHELMRDYWRIKPYKQPC